MDLPLLVGVFEVERALVLFDALLVTDFADFFDLPLFDDFLEALDLEDLGDLAARLSSLERRERFLSSELTVSRVPRATENAKNVAMKSTPFNVKKALALNLEKVDSALEDL